MENLLLNDRECFLCKTTIGLEEHHVFYGTGLRQLSEIYEMKVFLCHIHHRGPKGVHFDKSFDLYLKRLFQQRFEETYSHEKFIKTFGRNYLDERS